MKLKNNKGFTGVDVAISVVVLTIFVSVIASLFYNTANTSKKVERKSVATNLAIEVIEGMKVIGATDFNNLTPGMGIDEISALNSTNITVPNGYTVAIGIEDYRDENIVKILRVTVEYPDGKNTEYPDGKNTEQVHIETLVKNGEVASGSGSGGGETPEAPDVPTGPNGKQLASSVTTTEHTDNIDAEDSLGNKVVVPAGFKVVEGLEGEEITVQNGVVIEDSAGNQFVWIPIGVVTKNDGTQSNEIKLGRYIFSTSDGTPTLKQAAYTTDNETNYTKSIVINKYFYELSTARDGVVSTGLDGQNATAKDLAGFVDSVKANGGYYLARYEASYGSGSSKLDWKPLSQPSTANSTSSMSYTPGTLWNQITQLNAAQVARNMYAENKDANGNSVGVESDLVNSYAWDTAIVYIQEMGHTNYANTDSGSNTNLMNTGETGDVVCNIYDMAGNESEWITETSSYKTNSVYASICVYRGGNWVEYYTTSRNYGINTTVVGNSISFRSTLYVQ